MCGRYSLTQSDKLKKRYNLANIPTGIENNYNVAPTQTMPIIIEHGDTKELELMRWGIPRYIGPGKVKDIFNTRAEKAFHSWKKLVSSQRVLVPATGFYEWKAAQGGKQPFYIKPKNTEIFSLAGIWSNWKDEDGREIKTYSIITTEPNKEMSEIHNRMPVILHEKDEDEWISKDHDFDQDFLEELMRPYNNNGLEMYEVSKAVNVTTNNNENLIYPLNSK